MLLKRYAAKAAPLLGLVAIALLVGCGRAPSDRACTVVVGAGESIQTAIDGAPPGAVICLAAGTWEEHLVIDRPIVLRGEGAAHTFVRGTEYGRSVVRVVDAGPVEIERVTLTGATGGHVGHEDPSAGLTATGTARVEVREADIVGHSTAALLARDEAQVVVRQSSLTGNLRFGLVLQGGAVAELDATKVEGNGDGGVWVTESGQVTMRSCRIAHNHRFAMRLRAQAVAELWDVRIEGNLGPGIRLEDEAVARLDGCRLQDNRDPGVTLTNDARAELRATTVQGNWHGLQLDGRATVLIEESSILQHRWDAVRLAGASQAEILGTVLEGGRVGLSMTGQARARLTANEIRGFEIVGVSAFGQVLQGEDNRLSGNRTDLTGNVPQGFRLPLRAATRSQAVYPHGDYPTLQHAVDELQPGGVLTLQPGDHRGGVTIDKPLVIVGGPGVRITAGDANAALFSLVGGAYVRMVGLELVGNGECLAIGADGRVEMEGCVVRDGDPGIVLWDAATAVLRDCDLVTNVSAGMSLWGTSTATVETSRIQGNADVGILVADSARLSLSDSEISGNGRQAGWGGVLLRGQADAEFVGNTFVDNRRYGVAHDGQPCFGVGPRFVGRVAGGKNDFQGNMWEAVCPPAWEPSLTAPRQEARAGTP